MKDQYYRFDANLIDIINLDDLWYVGCKKCYKKVTVKKSSASCDYYKKKDIDYENRYRLKIDVSAKEVENIVLTLFRGARYFVVYEVDEYIRSTSEKKEYSSYYSKMEQSKGKIFSFLVKNPLNIPVEDKKKDLIVEEMYEVEKLGPEEPGAEPLSTKQLPKRAVVSGDTKEEEHSALDNCDIIICISIILIQFSK